MRYDTECPYCEEDIEINHDDGQGYAEDEIHEQECRYCGKTFVYTTSTHYYYDAQKAPCKNGEPHNLIPIHRYPEEFAVGKMQCSVCGEEITVDEEAHKKAVQSWRDKMNSDKQAVPPCH